MKRLLIAVACMMVVAGAWAATSELTFSANAFKPKDGGTTYAGQLEMLFPVGPFLAGPSVSVFHGDDFHGNAFGVAGEWNLGEKCGPGIGVAVHKPGGDAADLADLTGEIRAFFKCGSDKAFLKATARQVWSQAADGARSDPDGTSVDAGIGWRWGK